jgi:hypothetical protein
MVMGGLRSCLVRKNSPNDWIKLKEKAAKTGRDLSKVTLCVSPRGKRPEAILEDIPRYQELGATYLYLAFFNFARSYEEMADMMERFARDVKLI